MQWVMVILMQESYVMWLFVVLILKEKLKKSGDI